MANREKDMRPTDQLILARLEFLQSVLDEIEAFTSDPASRLIVVKFRTELNTLQWIMNIKSTVSVPKSGA
jgi:hypothetical protein